MATRPALQVRRPDFELDESLPRHWHGGDPFQTHFLDALSSVFPDGEAFFVRSVLRYKERVEDPELRAALLAFAGQEGQHSHQHDRHLALLQAHGYRLIERRNRIMGTALLNRRFPRYSLAVTAALEHLTALLARQLMTHPERWIAPMDPRMAALWQWHALEEAEHKSVAFDVLQIVSPGNGLRRLAMVLATLGLTAEALWGTSYMLIVDGRFAERAQWTGGWRFLFGREGLLRGAGPEYRRWFRRDFHPDEVDDTALIAHWQQRLGVAPAAAPALLGNPT